MHVASKRNLGDQQFLKYSKKGVVWIEKSASNAEKQTQRTQELLSSESNTSSKGGEEQRQKRINARSLSLSLLFHRFVVSLNLLDDDDAFFSFRIPKTRRRQRLLVSGETQRRRHHGRGVTLKRTQKRKERERESKPRTTTLYSQQHFSL